MTEFKLPESTNSFCDNQSDLYQSSRSKVDNEILFNKASNGKYVDAKILNVESTLSTKHSESTGPVKKQLVSAQSALGNTVGKLQGSKCPSNQQQVETDDQSELDEIAALQKQRQNQKKKQRKRNKKKE